eukprot:scaffold7878_cov126-Isochrysis_galbana.AAC.1
MTVSFGAEAEGAARASSGRVLHANLTIGSTNFKTNTPRHTRTQSLHSRGRGSWRWRGPAPRESWRLEARRAESRRVTYTYILLLGGQSSRYSIVNSIRKNNHHLSHLGTTRNTEPHHEGWCSVWHASLFARLHTYVWSASKRAWPQPTSAQSSACAGERLCLLAPLLPLSVGSSVLPRQSKRAGLVVAQSVVDLRLTIHHNRPARHHRSPDGLPRQDEDIRPAVRNTLYLEGTAGAAHVAHVVL